MIRLLRFRHLKERGIADSWPQLRRLMQHQGFPPGRLLGPQTRVWSEEEIDAWFAARPVKTTQPLRGSVKNKHEERLAKQRAAEAQGE